MRVIAGGRVVRDLKVQKDERAKFAGIVAGLERDREQWELRPISISVGDVSVDGMLKSIRRVRENGEEVIVFEFWENS